MNKIIILRIFLIGNTLYNSRSREIRVPPRTRIGSISSTWRRGHLESEYHEELEARSGSAGGYSRTRDALVAMAPILSRDVSNNRAACTKLSRNACFVRQRLKFYWFYQDFSGKASNRWRCWRRWNNASHKSNSGGSFFHIYGSKWFGKCEEIYCHIFSCVLKSLAFTGYDGEKKTCVNIANGQSENYSKGKRLIMKCTLFYFKATFFYSCCKNCAFQFYLYKLVRLMYKYIYTYNTLAFKHSYARLVVMLTIPRTSKDFNKRPCLQRLKICKREYRVEGHRYLRTISYA